MKTRKSVPVVALFAFLVAGAQAHAFQESIQITISPIMTVAALLELTIFGPTATTIELSSQQKAVVMNAQPDAADVLRGGAATDAFLAGKAALEEASGVALEDAQAAKGILEAGAQLE
ncbi:MAG: hypothetical protein NDJ90_14255 [Oligoflexia bacterium]|nr:hypothetical protein [Oligoflexia bacterium]